MVTTTELLPADLFRRCDPADIPFASTADARGVVEVLGQDRALEATRFALGVHHDGYNVFALGPDGIGKQTILRQLLDREAATRPTPADWCYVYNVADPQRPRALRLPAGTASVVRADLDRALVELRGAVRSAIDREGAIGGVRRVLARVRDAYRGSPAVLEYLAQVEIDILRRVMTEPEACDRLHRYEVHVVVDHGAKAGAPVIHEENPTHAHLLGQIEHVPETGPLAPERLRVHAGALHRANGGYLLLDARALLRQAPAWDALKRALRTHELRIESPQHPLGPIPTISVEPEPISLDLKVVVFGDRTLYYALAALDPELGTLFKVVADFEVSIDRGPGADAAYAQLIAGLVRKEALRPFDRGALARVIEQAARLASDAHKLSLRLGPLVDLLTEADDCARRANHPDVTAGDVQLAIEARLRRAGRLRDQMLEALRKKVLLIDTTGEAIGQVNAISVTELGGDMVAYPTRITAVARMGGGEVVDVEGEVELGGPVHAKGIMILTSLLGARFAQHVPLSLFATLVFEQSYGGIEGDSASLAELCALLSAIADVPIRQSIAVTGSVNQHGELQPIGGVNEKIEGFFDACRDRGLTGDQGVLIPRSNVQHLMLREDVVAAVAEHRFHLYAVDHVDEALALMTGREAGVRDADGSYPEASVNARVEARLAEFAQDAQRYLQGDQRGHRPRPGQWAHLARSRSQ